MRPPGPPLSDGASFDPATGRWRQIAAAPTPVGGVLAMTVVGKLLYLLTGDLSRDDSPVSFLSYDPETDTWSTLPPPRLPDAQLVAAGTRVVAAGLSDEQPPAEDAVFDPRTSSWERLPDDPLGPSYGRSAAWLGDRLLLTAPDLTTNREGDGPPLTRLAVLEGSRPRWTLMPDSDIIGGYPVWVADRVVFPMTGSADGGEVGNWGRDHANGAILDPATGRWTNLPEPRVARSARSGLEGALGSVGDRTLVGGQLLQPVTRRWTRVPAAPWGQGYRSSQTIVTGAAGILVWGGTDEHQNLAEGYFLPL